MLILGGLVGLMIVLMMFDWALIIVSSLTGAVMLTSLISAPNRFCWMIFAALQTVGILVQSR
jgi:hypothetical protein